MKSTHVYAVNAGWMYEVRIATRVIVFGWCASREEAERVAKLA